MFKSSTSDDRQCGDVLKIPHETDYQSTVALDHRCSIYIYIYNMGHIIQVHHDDADDDVYGRTTWFVDAADERIMIFFFIYIIIIIYSIPIVQTHRTYTRARVSRIDLLLLLLMAKACTYTTYRPSAFARTQLIHTYYMRSQESRGGRVCMMYECIVYRQRYIL